MNIFKAALAAIIFVITTNTIRDWLRAIREDREEEQKIRARMKLRR